MTVRRAALLLAALVACGGDDDAGGNPDGSMPIADGAPGPDVTGVADAGNKPDAGPAPDANTNCNSVSGIPTLVLTEIANNLDEPTSAVVPPGDTRIFITERPGTIRILDAGGQVLATPFLDLTALVDDAGSERGLLGLAFHPQYAQSGRFFVYYTGSMGTITLAEYAVSAGNPDVADAASGQILLTIAHEQGNHNGGSLAFGPDGYLYMGTGDGGGSADQMENAQNLTVLLGKLLRLDVDTPGVATPPPTNPFIGMGGGVKPEIWAYGLRNPWRISFDRETGDLWIGDVGQDYMEEHDFVAAGSPGGLNFGWDVMEGTTCFNDGPTMADWTNPLPTCTMTGLTLPVYEYPHNGSGASTVGGYVYRGCKMPDLRGTYFFGDTVDRYIKSFRFVGGMVTNETSYPQFTRIVYSFGEDPLGELLVLDGGNGRVYRLEPQ
jgi:hypothetical protein